MADLRQCRRRLVALLALWWRRQGDDVARQRDRGGRVVDGTDDLRLERRGAVAVAVLAAPSRRNAITADMRRALAAWYPRLARDAGVYAAVIRSEVAGVLSPGSDRGDASRDAASVRSRLAEEARLAWLAECFSKPTVSLIDGEVGGFAAELTLLGTHRVAAEGYRLQAADTVAGDVPGGGLLHALARLPDSIGTYLALTGASLEAADALALGLVTHVIPRTEHDAVVAGLAEADPVDPLLDDRHREALPGPIAGEARRIRRYFGEADLRTITRCLAAPAAGDEAWTSAALAALRRGSPLALHATWAAIRAAAHLDIRQSLIQAHRIACRLADGGEPVGGVVWGRGGFAAIEDVSNDVVERLLAPLPEGDLALPTRAEMQSMRA
jgi:enoyl-CoA hydratase